MSNSSTAKVAPVLQDSKTAQPKTATPSKYKLREPKGESFLEHMLHSRGILTAEDKQAFLNPDYNNGTHDPFLLKDMQKTVDRIIAAVNANEKIVIYSDFDADGIPGAVVLHDFFKKISYANTEHYIPHRHREGFGVHPAALDEIAKGGAKLIITIDCGIADIGAAAKAKEYGIDLIITDHHTPDIFSDGNKKGGAVGGHDLPDVYAIVNPKRSDCDYPEKMLCGSGVIFKVVQALCKSEPFMFRDNVAGEVAGESDTPVVAADESAPKSFIAHSIKPGWEKWLLDMVGIATLSDMVPLTGENRIFAHFGLTVLRKSPRLGLTKLFKSLKMNQAHLTEEDIAFMITPRINAASRMADPSDAFRLLSTTDDTEAQEMVDHLNNINTERKVQVAVLVKEMKKKIEERGLGEKAVIVIGNPDWKPPVLGLVATNIVRDYGRPAFLWGRDENGIIKGSCRSPDGVDIVSILRTIPSEVFLNLGGHVSAGGFSISDEHIHHIEEHILKAFDAAAEAEIKRMDAEVLRAAESDAAEAIGVGDMPGDIRIDKVLDPREVGRDLWRDIEKMAPFGMNNPKPLFILKGVIVRNVKLFGKTKEHIEVVLQNFDTGAETKAIKFFAAEDTALMKKLVVGEPADVIAHMEKSMFKNYPEYRLRVVEVV